MIKVLFICHGNICRSPMAEYILKDLARKAGIDRDLLIASAATSDEDLNKDVYPPAKKVLSRHGISSDGHISRQLRKEDYTKFDMLITMDNANYRNTLRLFDNDPDGKVTMFTEYSTETGEIADPWFTRDFETCYNSVYKGCKGLIEHLKNNISC